VTAAELYQTFLTQSSSKSHSHSRQILQSLLESQANIYDPTKTSVIWDCESVRTSEGYYRTTAGIEVSPSHTLFSSSLLFSELHFRDAR
jgi:hypothetical protein